MPQVDIPTIQVAAELPGANAETMATSVAAPLERTLGADLGRDLDQLDQFARAHTGLQVEFDLGRNVDGAAQDVQSAISAAAGPIAEKSADPPTYEKVNPADALLMSIAVTSDDLPISAVDQYVETDLAPKISRIAGVGLVDFPRSSRKPAIRVQIDPAVVVRAGRRASKTSAARSVHRNGQCSEGHTGWSQAVADTRHHRSSL